MMEIIENGLTFLVSDSYPKPPYFRVLKQAPAPVEKSQLDLIQEKIDKLIVSVGEIKALVIK